MAQLLPEVPSFGKQFAQQLGGGLGRGLSEAADFATQLAKAKAKVKLERELQKEQVLGSLSQGAQGAPNLGENLRKGESEGFPIPNNQLAGGEAANQILSEAQIGQAADALVRQRAGSAYPISEPEAKQLIRRDNDARKAERAEKEQYGTLASESLAKYLPDASPRMLAAFAKKFENLGYEELSGADMQKKISSAAFKYANNIKAIDKSLPPPRFWNKAYEKITDTEQSRESNDAKVKKLIKPLLDDGLYAEAESLLTKRGFGPEEAANHVYSLGSGVKKTLASFPDITPPKAKTLKEIKQSVKAKDEQLQRGNILEPRQQEILEENLEQAIAAQPGANLLLLRKAYEDKGVDWRSFDKAVTNLMQKGWDPDENQQQDISQYLNQPPLNRITKILHKIGIVGR